jgi:hypothetical protein
MLVEVGMPGVAARGEKAILSIRREKRRTPNAIDD